VRVTTGPGCSWTATSPGDFVQVIAVTGALDGSGIARLNVLRNTGQSRTGSAEIVWPTGKVTITVSQEAGPPVAVIKAPIECDVYSDVPCRFDGSQSAGVITQWRWDFGDGESGSGATIDHDYANWLSNQSVYERHVSVTLTVIGPYGSDSATAIVRVYLIPDDLLRQ
jgi:bacillopeptidase F